MELDIWIPKLSLAFEYQGQQHYRDLRLFGTRGGEEITKDKKKLAACNEAGIKLVVVPYWWDQEEGSLTAIINECVQ